MNLIGCHDRHVARLVVGILQDGHAEKDGHGGSDKIPHGAQYIGPAGGMDRIGPLLLAQPHDQHLVQAALDVSFENLMRLDSIDDDDPVGSVGMLIDIDRNVIDDAQLDDLHR